MPRACKRQWDAERGLSLKNRLLSLLGAGSIRGAARVSGVSPTHLAAIFRGAVPPSDSILERLAAAAGTEPEDLLHAAEADAGMREEKAAADARLLAGAVAYAEAELSKRPELFDFFRANFCAFLIASGRADLALASSLYSSLSSPSCLSARLAGASPATLRAMLHALAYVLSPLEYAASGNVAVRDFSLGCLPAGLAKALRRFASSGEAPSAEGREKCI